MSVPNQLHGSLQDPLIRSFKIPSVYCLGNPGISVVVLTGVDSDFDRAAGSADAYHLHPHVFLEFRITGNDFDDWLPVWSYPRWP